MPANLGTGPPRQTAHEFVRETLRHAILNGSLKGGTRLVQADLAQELKVSTTPVREALRDLDAEGLIRLDAHRGGVVLELSSDELKEIYDLRLLLETSAIRLSAQRITDEYLDKAEEIHRQMEAAPHSASWVALNRKFHLTLYEAAQSPRLLSILTGLLDASVIYVSTRVEASPDLRTQAGRDHAHLIAMLRARDADGAEEAIKQHLGIPGSMLDLN